MLNEAGCEERTRHKRAYEYTVPTLDGRRYILR